jgi:DNA-binding MarR family transcriptional regulator
VLLNHPTLTKMVDRMVSDSLVYRFQDAEDRREVLMFSSDAALEFACAEPGVPHRRKLRQQQGDGGIEAVLENLFEKAN